MPTTPRPTGNSPPKMLRSEEHTSELQSQSNLVCRLLLEKKNRARHRTPTQRRISQPHRLPPAVPDPPPAVLARRVRRHAQLAATRLRLLPRPRACLVQPP